MYLEQAGSIINQPELAHFGQISTTRMTQIIWLTTQDLVVKGVAQFVKNDRRVFCQLMALK